MIPAAIVPSSSLTSVCRQRRRLSTTSVFRDYNLMTNVEEFLISNEICFDMKNQSYEIFYKKNFFPLLALKETLDPPSFSLIALTVPLSYSHNLKLGTVSYAVQGYSTRSLLRLINHSAFIKLQL